MKFDWYQATLEREPDWIKSALQEQTGGEWEEARPFARASKAALLRVDDSPALFLLQDGIYQHPHVIARGEEMPDETASWLREMAPEHLVARADVAADLVAPGWFEKAWPVMRDLSIKMGVAQSVAGDWHSHDPERTFYMGSVKSPVRARLYEKTPEMRAKHPMRVDDIPDHWTRLEVQVRPEKREGKMRLATVPAAEVWGCSRWSRTLSEQLLDSTAPRHVIGTKWREPDLERSLFYAMRQYGDSLEKQAAILGSWELLGGYLEELRNRHR